MNKIEIEKLSDEVRHYSAQLRKTVDLLATVIPAAKPIVEVIDLLDNSIKGIEDAIDLWVDSNADPASDNEKP